MSDASASEPPLRDDRSDAVLSADRTYRYRLTRTWDTERPRVVFIMLNPSTADETDDDPTLRRCINYAKAWGYGKLVVGNLFAYRTSEPADLRTAADPVGPENDSHLRRLTAGDPFVVAAWGAHGDLYDRGREVVELLDVDLHALDTTADGQPVHPLYQPADAEPDPYTPP